MRSTREKIMDAAERCFARQGIASASIRTIVKKADVNLGAVTYHFGTKDNLVVEIFKRRMVPMTEERLEMLQVAKDKFEDSPVPLRKVIEAIVIPQYKLNKKFPQFVQFLVQMKNYPSSKFYRLINDEFDIIYRELHHSLRVALPPMTNVEFYLKLHFLIHLMDTTPKHDYHLQRLIPEDLDSDGVTDVLIAFLEGGLNSPCLQTNRADGDRQEKKEDLS